MCSHMFNAFKYVLVLSHCDKGYYCTKMSMKLNVVLCLLCVHCLGKTYPIRRRGQWDEGVGSSQQPSDHMSCTLPLDYDDRLPMNVQEYTGKRRTWAIYREPPNMGHIQGTAEHGPYTGNRRTWPTYRKPQNMAHIQGTAEHGPYTGNRRTWPTYRKPQNMAHISHYLQWAL